MLEGYVHPDFRAVARTLAGQIPRTGIGGAAVCIYHEGRVVVDLWGGTRDRGGSPWRADTMAPSFSTTKGITSTALHVLADRGLVDYDRPVADYWPEFAQAGKERITVRQLLSHEAGLYGIRHMIDDAHRMLDWDHMVERLAAHPPAHEPGAAHGYHGFTYGWLVGELVQRVAGRPFREVLREELAEPLELDGLYCGLPPEELPRRAELVASIVRGRGRPMKKAENLLRKATGLLRMTGSSIDLAHSQAALMPRGIELFDFNAVETALASLPAANGTFTARSLARVYAAIAGGGAVGGVRILRPETVEQMGRIQNKTRDRVIPLRMRWRLGYHGIPAVGVNVRAGFGHAGFGGSGAWADPSRNLAAAMVLNSGVGTPFGDLRMIQISIAAVRAADARRASAHGRATSPSMSPVAG